MSSVMGRMVSHVLRSGISVNFDMEWDGGDDAENYSFFCPESGLKVMMVQKDGTYLDEEDWFPVLVHEYCHFQQWLDGNASTTLQYPRAPACGTDFYPWLKGDNKLSKEELKLVFEYVILMERDCEERTIATLNEECALNDCGVDVARYTQKANAYIMLHPFVRKHRQWPTTAPSLCKKVLDSLPVSLIEFAPSLVLDTDFEAMVIEECFTDFKKPVDKVEVMGL